MTDFMGRQTSIRFLLVMAFTTILGCPTPDDESGTADVPQVDMLDTVGDLPVGNDTVDELLVGSDTLDDLLVGSDTLEDLPVGSDTLDDVLVGSDTLDDLLVGSDTLDDLLVDSDTLDDLLVDSEDVMVDLCADFSQPGCVQTGCPDGEFCDTTIGCIPSVCACDPATGDIMCTADCGGGTCVPKVGEVCCDPALEPGTGDLPFCFEGATCCANGDWTCNLGNGQPSCDETGVVCPED